MFRYLFTGLLVVAIVVGAYVGCGPRAQVAGQKVLDKIDGWIGKLDIKLKDITNEYDKLSNSVDGIKEAKNIAKSKLEGLRAEKEKAEKAIVKAGEELAEIKAGIEGAGSQNEFEFHGKMTSKESLMVAGKVRLKLRKSKKTELEGRINPLIKTYEKSFAIHTKNEKATKAQLENLESKIEQIKAEKTRLDTMRQTEVVLGDGASISDQFDKLDKSVNELLIEVRAKADVESENVDERLAGIEEDGTLDDEIFSGSDNAEADFLAEIGKEIGDDQ